MQNAGNGVSKIVLIFVCMLYMTSNAAESEKQQPQRTLTFGGYNWTVRSNYGGPGPNYWSDSEENVWLDENGYLHLKITRAGGRWYCSEIYTNHYSQYGNHIFVVEGDIDAPDKNTVLGLFNYANDTHEIDIEFSRWGNANSINNTSYTVQPYTISGNSKSNAFKIDSIVSVHKFNWQPTYIIFSSWQGLIASPATIFPPWVYRGSSIPSDTDKLRVMINFWLFQGAAPVDTTRLEVIIRDVVIPKPLGTQIDDFESYKNSGFILEQNYPNPFNPDTAIRFHTDTAEHVVINIYDVNGKMINTLVNSFVIPGEHSVQWNGADLHGAAVASGVYVYKLIAGNFSQAKKMLLIR